MDYTKFAEELQKVPLFDLYRLQTLIGRLLDEPEAIEEIRSHLKPGQVITYFDAAANGEIEARVIEIRRTRLLVEHTQDKQRWTIPFYYVNLARADTEIRVAPGKIGLSKNQVKLGDRVGFHDNQNRDLYGVVVKLNQKTATIVLDDTTRWRVSYKFLYPVIEGAQILDSKLIEGKVIRRS